MILNFYGAPYTPPNGGSIGLDLATGGVVGPPPPPGKPDFALHSSGRWGRGRLQLRTAVPAFASGRRIRRAFEHSIANIPEQLLQASYSLATRTLTARGNAMRSSWGGLCFRVQNVALEWQLPAYRASRYGVTWGENKLSVSALQMGWHDPNLRVDTEPIEWSGQTLVVDQLVLSWPTPDRVRQNSSPLRWGVRWSPPYCIYTYIPELDAPGGQLRLSMVAGYTALSGAFVGLEFRLTDQPVRCFERDESGPKYGNPPVPPVIKITRRPYELEVYHMPVSIAMKRLSDNAPIGVLRASVSIDLESWAWTLRAELMSDADLALVAPVGSTLRDVELSINGHIWRFTVESQSRGRRFGKSTFSISGRSRSASLAMPYAEPQTYTETSIKTAQQLATDALAFTGWTLDWQIPDWLVAADSLSVSEKTPIEIVNLIAAAAGAVVQTDPSASVLHVMSRYPLSPWAWAGSTPDVALPPHVIKSLDSDWQPGPPFNRIFVSGEHAGVNLDLTRHGTAGDKVAPMVVDRLLTEVTANRERGRVELAKSGKKSVETMDLPLAAPPDEPALIMPGSLIEVDDELATWRGQVLSVAIDASNGDAITVNQKLTVERAY